MNKFLKETALICLSLAITACGVSGGYNTSPRAANNTSVRVAKNENGEDVYKGLKISGFQFERQGDVSVLFDVVKRDNALFVRASKCDKKNGAGLRRINDDQLAGLTNSILAGRASITAKKLDPTKASTGNQTVFRAKSTVNGIQKNIEIKEPTIEMNGEVSDVFTQLSNFACG